MTGDHFEGSGTDELDGLLLDAKLSIPQPRPAAVSRASIISSCRASARRVVAVTAPAGYGKSTLLAQWADTEDRRVAWVSLDRLDDDPMVLLSTLASAYARVSPEDADLIADMGGLGTSALGRAAPRLASVLRTSPAPFVFMLDDLHELQSPACHDVLGVVIAGIPQGSQLVAASRSEQPHLARLRASGDALELAAEDLALDPAGAKQIFAEASVSLTDDSAATVIERTEGWPVGLYLASLIASDGKADALAVSGDDRYVADYLYRESVMQLPEETQRFLRWTAMLDQVSGSLCDAVLESTGSHEMLRNLERSNTFLIPLDRRRDWYRYHALFREFLEGELGRVEPEIVMTLHLRAADWYEANGSSAIALHHLLNTDERERCVHLATALTLETYAAGQMSTVQRWLSALGNDAIEGYPPLAVLAGWVTAMTGQTADAQRWAAIVDAATFDLTPADGTASFASARAMLRTAMCPAGPEQAMTDATFAVAQEPPWSPWRDQALGLAGEAYLLMGETERAEAAFEESSGVSPGAGNSDAFVISESERALLAMDRGRWDEAADRLGGALAAIDHGRMHDYAMSVLAFAGAARLALHRGDLDAVNRHLTQAMRARPTLTFVLPAFAIRVRLHLGKVFWAIGDHTTARHLMREIDDILLQRPSLGALVDDVADFRAFMDGAGRVDASGGPPLSPAELRLLPYLQTHLTLREIGDRLFVSRNTVSSEVTSIYRKLGVSSRNDAVERATAIGLLGG